MRNIFLISFLILTAQNGFSQEWNVFVPDQKSYYKQQYEHSARVEDFLPDSILKTGDITVLYFNSRSNLKPDCYNHIRKEMENPYWPKNPDKIDSLIQVNDSVLFITDYAGQADTFIFKPNARLNDSWVTNGITIKCTETGKSEVFGNQDSVKTFLCFGNGFEGIEFMLSKTYGFTKFMPFKEFIYHSGSSGFPPYFELIGYSNKGFSAGYKQPDFNAYFHLSAGDMLYWRDYSNPDDITSPDITTYHVDSITDAYISSDSVHYDYKRTYYNENGTIAQVGNYSDHFLRKDQGAIVQNHTSWFGMKYSTYPPDEVFFLESLYFTVENNDTITYAQYWLPGWIVDTSDCRIGFTADYEITARFSTREGLIFRGQYSWGEHSVSLTGSEIDGITYGITDIPTGTENFEFRKYPVYPNPFIDVITIDAPGHGISQIEIYDMSGNLVTRQAIIPGKINLERLAPGVYLLKITDVNNKSRQMKIVKR